MATRRPLLRPHALGYFSDERVPVLDGPDGPLENLGIDISEFEAWLGPKLGNYRGNLDIKRQMPTAEDERNYIAKFGEALDLLAPFLAPITMPPIAGAHISYESFRAKFDWSAKASAMQLDIVHMQVVLQRAAQRLDVPARRGRPSTAQRDHLLAEMKAWLAPRLNKADLAETVAASVLTACGIPIQSAETVKKAARRGKK